MGRKNILSLLILAGVILALPLGLGNSYYLNVLVFVGIYSLITIGLSLLMGYTGQISLGHAAFFGLGAYTSGVLSTKFGVSPWLALLAAIFVTGGIAFLIAAPALKLKGHYLAMATLAFGYIVFIVFNQASSLTGGPSGFGQIPRFRLGNFLLRSDVHYYYLVWSLVIVVLWVSLNIIHSRVGRALRSIHEGELTANIMGVNTAKYKIQVFVLSAVYASLAGSLYAHFITFLNPTPFGFHFSIVLVAMVAVGGMASVWGAMIGAALLTILPEYLRAFHDYDILIYGSILLLIMMFLPKGLFAGILSLIKKER
ncbi:branched-chain amino acid ABC transporter permease [Candidatus Aerophobetes bacterium]|uniref:Branched-chain amino acid ABC transporter permease n=1 Tax=Aerophobetes bacterium TaxID=2030807 RepID=A0A523YNS0_UNCAE|nr:MAG: branched-chain amino acid ABC transporter permease [Candidatus Aerophobetes bacterium]